MKTYWVSGGIAPRILDIGRVTHWIEGYLRARAGLHAVAKGKILEPRSSSRLPSQCTD
jgi:hypothetical protein